MRTRQKLTAGGALVLAGMAIGGGAMVTSQAMADGEEPVQGTLTVVALTAGADEAVRCTYDDILLPTGPILSAAAAGGQTVALGELPQVISIVNDAGMTSAGAGGVMVQSGTISMLDEAGALTVSGVPPAGLAIALPVDASLPDALPTGAGSAALPATAAPAGATDVVISGADARPGTDAECAEMRPSVSIRADAAVPAASVPAGTEAPTSTETG